MKRVLFLMVAFLMSGTVLFAQYEGETVFGFRGGMLIGFHSAGDLGDMSGFSEDSKFNFNIAGYFARGISDTISIQGELNFMINQGMKLSYTDYDYGYTYTYGFSYTTLDIPVLIRYRKIDSKIGFLVGLHLSIPIGKLEYEEKITDSDYGYIYDESKTNINTEGVAIGFTGGIFGRIPVGSGHLVGDIRLIYDFSGHKVKGGDDFISRRGLAITIGYEFYP